MSSLIVVHGAGDPSEQSLIEATHGIASAFPWVAEENRYFVNWNALAADRILHSGQVRWASVERMFQALRVAMQVAWISGTSLSRVAQFNDRAQRALLSVGQLCFRAAIIVVVLIPAIGIVNVSDSAFLVEAPPLRAVREINPIAFWIVPAPLINQILTTGF
jgi:hypothetical protein